MNERYNFLLMRIALAVVVLSILSFIVGLSSLTFFESFRIVFGVVYVLFLPGFVWSYVFFPLRRGFSDEKGIDVIERIALSFALSIAIVPLVVFYLNLVGLKISAWSSFFVVLVIVGLGVGIIFWKKKHY